jgi:hypothetical protein
VPVDASVRSDLTQQLDVSAVCKPLVEVRAEPLLDGLFLVHC